MDGKTAVTLSAKIREDLERESALQEQRDSVAAAEGRLRSLLVRPPVGKSRLKAHKGQLSKRVDATRRRARVAAASRRRNRK